MRRFALLSFALLLACGDDVATDAGSADVGRDATADASADAADAVDVGEDVPSLACDTPAPFAQGAEPAPVILGEGVVAGRLTAAQLPPGNLGLSEWQDGDFVLANDQVAVLFSREDHDGQTYDPYGGRMVGIAGVDGNQLVDAADFSLIVMTIGRFLVATRSITVMNDGSDGEAAVVRVTGPLAPLTALGEVIEVLSSLDFTGTEGAIDYTLEPGANAVDVTMRVNPHRQLVSTTGGLQVFFQANRMPAWRPLSGFGDTSGQTPLVAFTDDVRTNYAWTAPREGTLTALISFSGADVFSTGPVRLTCGENIVPLGRIVIGADGGMPALMKSLDDDGGQETAMLSGRVVDSDGEPVGGVRVHALGPDDEHLSRFVVDDTGAFSEPIDSRVTELYVWRDGFPLAGPFAVAADNVLELPVASTIRVTATEATTGNPFPVRVEVFRVDGEVPNAPDAFGERSPGSGRIHFENPIDGLAALQVPAGEYRVRVGHGPTYERVEQVVVVDGEVLVEAAIDEVFPNPGVLCGDFHLHTHGSVDSPDRADDKLRSVVANGVQIAIRTEHEVIRDYSPIITDLGLDSFVKGFIGLELSTVEYGHFNTFPLEMTDGPGNGAPLWPGLLPTELFDTVRNRPEAPTVTINHPRSGGPLQGYFNAAEYDSVTGTVGRPEMWDEEFRVVEIFNDSNFESNREGTVADWFSLLNQGRQIAAVGSSDSHRINSVPPGYPRTCLQLGTSTPSEVTGPTLQDALERGASIIYGGIDLRVSGPDGAAPGDVVMESGATAMFNVTLIAADYVDVNRLEVIVDGVTTRTIAIDAMGAGVRYDEDIAIDVAESGSWVIFHAAGDEAFNANGSRPFAVSNPVFLVR
ncbi:MAG: hypothetical protein ACI9KE_006434 [Polyangiales bacterium]|jgi:hypothetical protein